MCDPERWCSFAQVLTRIPLHAACFSLISYADSLVGGLRDLLRLRPIHQLVQCVHVRPRAADDDVFVRSRRCKAALCCPALDIKSVGSQEVQQLASEVDGLCTSQPTAG